MEVSYSRQHSDELYAGASQVANPARVRTTFAQQTLHLSYRRPEVWRWNLVIPREDIVRQETGVPDVNLHGLGDLTLFAEWQPFRNGRAADAGARTWLEPLAVVFGARLPTGEEGEALVPGTVAPSLLQLGSGTVDPILGFHWQRWRGGWTMFHHSTAQFALGRSGAGLKAGEVLETSTGAGYRVAGRLLPTFSIQGLFRGQDELNGAPIGNTGAVLWFATPGLSAKLRENLSIEASARIPFYRDVRSTQLVPGVRWQIGLSWSF